MVLSKHLLKTSFGKKSQIFLMVSSVVENFQ